MRSAELREEARAQSTETLKLLLDNVELKELWVVLDSHTSGPALAEEQMMDWDQFVVRSLVTDKCREYSGPGFLPSFQQEDRLEESVSWPCSTYEEVWLTRPG